MSDLPEPPDRTKKDAGHAAIKAVIGTVPIVGAAGAELFAYLIEAPYEKRKQEWMREVGDALGELRDAGRIDVEKLRDDPAFTDTVLAATQVALRTTEGAKRDALRNAILNSALPLAPEAAVRHTFVRLIDELTQWHLRILDLFDDPVAWFERPGAPALRISGGALASLLENAYPALRPHRDLYDQWWRDLYQRGLLSVDQPHTMMSGQGLMASRTTTIGKQFLGFVRDPRDAA